jgi:hypothetical protein
MLEEKVILTNSGQAPGLTKGEVDTYDEKLVSRFSFSVPGLKIDAATGNQKPALCA